MAIKTKLDKESYDALQEPLKALYKESNGSYVMDLDEGEDLDVVRRAKEAAKQEARDAKKRAAELEAQLAEVSDGAARKTGDIEALDKSWNDKLTKANTDSAARISRLEAMLQEQLVDSKAVALAAELAGDDAALILPHIRPRLKAELDGEAPTTRVLDQNGQISALTLDELKKELVANPLFAKVIIGSKATGGGAASVGAGGGASGKKIANMTFDERKAHLAQVGEAEFNRQVQAQRS